MAKFDPKQFEKDRQSVKLSKEAAAREAARTPAPAPRQKKIEPLNERIVFGMGSRKKMTK